MERQAVADVRTALTKTVCAVLELCQEQGQQQKPEQSPAAAADGDRLYVTGGRTAEGSVWWEGGAQGNVARGPPSALVQMVCSGEDANVRCAASEYRLSTGMATASRCAAGVVHGNKPSGDGQASDGQRRNVNTTTRSNSGRNVTAGGGGHGRENAQPPQSPPSSSSGPQEPLLEAAGHRQSSRLKELATTVTEAGTTARTIISGLSGLLDPKRQEGTTQREPSRSPLTDLLSSGIPSPAMNPREALSAARTASAGVRSFSNDIKVGVGAPDNGTNETEMRSDRMSPFGSSSRGGREGSNANGSGGYWGAQTAPTPRNGGASAAGNCGGKQVDTTASTRVVNALRGDILWAESLPAYVRKALEAVKCGFSEQLALK